MNDPYDVAAIMGGLYGDGIIGLKGAFSPEFADTLYEDMMSLFEEARQILREFSRRSTVDSRQPELVAAATAD